MAAARFRGCFCLYVGLILMCSCSGGRMATVTEGTGSIRQDLASGHVQKALDTCHTEYQKAPKASDVSEQYVATIEHVKGMGDRAFQKEDFALAGETYGILFKNFSRFDSFANLSFDRNYLTSRIRVSRIRLAERQAQSYLSTGSLQKAINVYGDLLQHYPRDPTVQAQCTALLESIETRAELAFEKDDLALAGSAYRVLQKNFGTNLFRACSLSFSRDHVDGRIAACRRKLFDDGLEQYRSGNLPRAIAAWKSILTFDPEDPEVKKATETATLQMKNLEKEKTRGGR